MKNLKKLLGCVVVLSINAAFAISFFFGNLTVSANSAYISGPADNTREIEAQVLYYRDYEDYTSGAEVYGAAYGTGISSYIEDNDLNNKSTTAFGADGIAVDFGKGNSAPTLTFENPVSDGKVYIGFDVEGHTASELLELGIKGKKMVMVIKSSDNSMARNIRFATGGLIDNGWLDIANFGPLADGYHRLEVLIDIDNKKVYSYLDGVYQGTKGYIVNNLKQIFAPYHESIKKWDNFAVVYYPEGAKNTFSLVGKAVNCDTNTITVDFDNDAKGAAYPAILTKTMGVSDFTVTNSVGSEVLVESVTKNIAFGSYDLVLADGVASGETYTVSVASDLVTAMGATIEGTQVQVPAPTKKLNVSVNITVDENGTLLTEENVPAVGGTVYAEVTYTNTTGENVTFTVLGATYSANRMTNLIVQSVTAPKTADVETKVYLPITVTNAENFTAKAFAVNNLTSITPI